MSFYNRTKRGPCVMCISQGKEAVKTCQENTQTLRTYELSMMSDGQSAYIMFPSRQKEKSPSGRSYQRQLWVKHCNVTEAEIGETAAVALWHFLPEVLLEVHEARLFSNKSQFPWYTSNENGKKYSYDRGLQVPSRFAPATGYMVVPTVTSSLFRELVITNAYKPGGDDTSSLTESTGSRITTRSGFGSASKEDNASGKGVVEEVVDPLSKSLTEALERLAELPVGDAYIDERSKIIATLSTFFGKKISENVAQRCEMASLSKTVRDLRLELLDVKDKLEDMQLSGMSGMGRAQLTNADWHKKYPHACKDIFLFNDFEEMKAYFEAFWPDTFGPTIDDAKRFGTSRARSALTDFEKCLITLMRVNMRYMRHCDLALIWDTSKKTIARSVKEWAPRLRKIGNQLSILDVSEEYLKESCPQSFVDANLMDVGGLVDGKVVMTDENRKNSALKGGSWSDKVHHAGVIFLQYCLPNGLIFEHSPVALARASEDMCVRHMGLNSSPLVVNVKQPDGTMKEVKFDRRLGKIRAGKVMLTDRGFATHARFYPNKNFHIFPAFLTGRQQFTNAERVRDKPLCKLRWVNEANFARLLYVSSLSDVVRTHFFPYIPCAVSWGFAISNLQQPYTPRHTPNENGGEESEGGDGAQAGDDAMDVEGDGDDDDSDEDDDGSRSGSNNTRGTKRSGESLTLSPLRRFGGRLRSMVGNMLSSNSS